MSPTLALIVCMVGVSGLFYLDRNESLRTSRALWLPVIWLYIIGSRPLSVWLGISQAVTTAAQAAEGSLFDASIFGVLLAGGIIVLIIRRRRLNGCLKASFPCLIYFAYCLLSVLWSDYSDLAFKRWIKAIGDLVMVFILATDNDPVSAIGRLISRTGFLLIPASILLIRYFENLGRGYDPDGIVMNTGVTTNKNELGVITLVISLGAVWRFLVGMFGKRQPGHGRSLLARGTLVAFCVAVLAMADSATSIACFILGTTLLIATYLPMIRHHPRAVHLLIMMLLLCGGLIKLLGGQEGIVHALGRKPNLTNRTAIWAAVLPVVPNPIVGAGFESFWVGPRLEQVYSRLSKYMQVNEAHNGYIEVYLNLGWIGVGLIGIILISGYQGAVAVFRQYPAFGGLMLAYVAAATIYSISEAGFRMLDPMWMFLLLAVIGSHSLASGVADRTRRPIHTRACQVTQLLTGRNSSLSAKW